MPRRSRARSTLRPLLREAALLALGALVVLAFALPALAQHTGAPGDPTETENTDGELDAGVCEPTAVTVQSLIADASVPIARGRGVTVTAGEFVECVRAAPEPTQRTWANNPRLLDELLDRMVSDRLLANEARRRGLDRDPAVQAALERALIARLRATVINPSAADASQVTDAQIREFYDSHPQRFHIPERRTARVIFLARRHDAERVLLLATVPRRRHALPDFRVLAEQQNTVPELAREGGELRELTPTTVDIDATLRDAIFAIERPGTTLPSLVQGRWGLVRGFFVVRLTSRRAAIDRTLAESADWIRYRLALELRVQAERAMVERLAREAGVTRVPADRIVRMAWPDGGAGDGGERR